MLMNEHEELNRNHYMIFGLSWAGWVFDFYDLVLFTFLIAPIQASLGFSAEMLSLCLGISLFATGLGGIIFGALGDKYGRRKVLQWTIIVYSIGTLLCAFSWSFYSLVAFRFITGLGVGGEWATGQIYINETFPDNLRAKFGAFMQSGAPVGVILASIVGGMVSPVIGWRMTFLVSILPALSVVFIRKSLNESDVWLQNKDKYTNKSIFHEFKELFVKTKESFLSILPIVLMVVFLHFTVVPLNNMLGSFFIGSLCLMIGMSLFTLGADNAMMPMGNKVGSFLARHKKLSFFITNYHILNPFKIKGITMIFLTNSTKQKHTSKK